MSQEVKTRDHKEIMEEFRKMIVLSKEDEEYLIVVGVCASFYRWLFCKTETKVSSMMGEIIGGDQYWSREVGQC